MINPNFPDMHFPEHDIDMFYLSQCIRFTSQFDATKYASIDFGRQDKCKRYSITFNGHNGQAMGEIEFQTKHELLGYVTGYNNSIDTI